MQPALEISWQVLRFPAAASTATICGCRSSVREMEGKSSTNAQPNATAAESAGSREAGRQRKIAYARGDQRDGEPEQVETDLHRMFRLPNSNSGFCSCQSTSAPLTAQLSDTKPAALSALTGLGCGACTETAGRTRALFHRSRVIHIITLLAAVYRGDNIAYDSCTKAPHECFLRCFLRRFLWRLLSRFFLPSFQSSQLPSSLRRAGCRVAAKRPHIRHSR